MKIVNAVEEDAKLLDEIIKEEFPYTHLNIGNIKEKVTDKKYFILKAIQKNIFAGFIEIEFFEKDCRLNAVFVEDSWRGQGIAHKLIKKCEKECKNRRIKNFFLLVKKTNEDAKKVYAGVGFFFVKLHDKRIEDEDIEVWKKEL